jgi:uncharacterized protein YecA (UPF0149 family)
MKVDWDDKDARKLERALAARPGALGYCELAGFFFALACAPALLKPSRWLTLAVGQELPESENESQVLLDLVTALHNHVNLQCLNASRRCPPA